MMIISSLSQTALYPPFRKRLSTPCTSRCHTSPATCAYCLYLRPLSPSDGQIASTTRANHSQDNPACIRTHTTTLSGFSTGSVTLFLPLLAPSFVTNSSPPLISISLFFVIHSDLFSPFKCTSFGSPTNPSYDIPTCKQTHASHSVSLECIRA